MSSWLIRVLTLGLLAVTLPLAVRGLYGPPGALVHVRWQPSVDAAERQRLETEWQLVDGEEMSPDTWRYDLTAPSEARLRTIVGHAAVADTHHIDRQGYTLAPEAPRTSRRAGVITLGGEATIGFVDLLAILLAVLAGSGVVVRHPVQALRGIFDGVEPFRGEGAREAVEISERPLVRVASVAAIIVGVAALAAITARSEIFANDDTYIYFNYAKNIVAGHPFAYDPRNIASEGFTSVIYLLLLVPFEAAGINMMFAAAALNLAAIATIFYLSYRVLRVDRVLDGAFPLIALILFAAFMARDSNIPTIVGRGLETMLGPASVLWAILHLALVHQASDGVKRLRAVNMFLVASFLSFLIRPESIVLLAAVGVLILMDMQRRGQFAALLVRLGAFVAALIVYFVGKWILFGDLMQTSYYRKIRAGAGREYVMDALTDYGSWLVRALVLAVVVVGLSLWRRRGRGWKALLCLVPRSSVLAISMVAAGTLLVFLPSEPLVGYAYRYLVNFYVLLYLLVAAGTAYLLSVVSLRVERRFVYAGTILTGLVSVLWVGSVAARDIGTESVVERLRLYKQAEESTARHEYIRIGEFLRGRIPDIEELTFVFGDAGALPYALGSRFVDANGLTEPYIARLFPEPDGPEKAKKFADYVLSWQPDVIIVAFGRADNGRWVSPLNIHSPFLGPTPMSVFRAYRDYGVGYVCTAHAYYDLHFGVRQTSNHFKVASEALLEYCGQNGVVLPEGLTVTLEGEEVHFPRLTP